MIPEFIKNILFQLENNGYQAFVVGGCVRDILMERGDGSNDWDVTTDAHPKDILEVFQKGKYNNEYGTVLLPVHDEEGSKHTIEITTFRSESGYSDARHPDEVRFESRVDKDLHRRDFTVNALAMKPADSPIPIPQDLQKWIYSRDGYYIIDFFGGQKDIREKVIRAVGEPRDRFKEDALRMIRAIRFACQLDFSVEPKTERAIQKMSGSLKFIAQERIRDELIKILSSDRAYKGVMLLHKDKLLQYLNKNSIIKGLYVYHNTILLTAEIGEYKFINKRFILYGIIGLSGMTIDFLVFTVFVKDAVYSVFFINSRLYFKSLILNF